MSALSASKYRASIQANRLINQLLDYIHAIHAAFSDTEVLNVTAEDYKPAAIAQNYHSLINNWWDTTPHPNEYCFSLLTNFQLDQDETGQDVLSGDVFQFQIDKDAPYTITLARIKGDYSEENKIGWSEHNAETREYLGTYSWQERDYALKFFLDILQRNGHPVLAQELAESDHATLPAPVWH